MINKDYILNTLKSKKTDLNTFGIIRIGLFGSYVSGEESEDSDIDFLIEFEAEKDSFDNFMAAYDYFEDLFKDKKIELITRNSLSPYIGPFILKEVVYA